MHRRRIGNSRYYPQVSITAGVRVKRKRNKTLIFFFAEPRCLKFIKYFQTFSKR